MIQLIIIWTLLILAIVLPWIIAEINFRKQVKELDEEFYREARRIDELEETTASNSTDPLLGLGVVTKRLEWLEQQMDETPPFKQAYNERYKRN